jgi:TRAP-type C4-dicarboxylate transport system permease small subunit
VFLLSEIVKRISRFGNWIGMSVLILMMILVISNIILRLFGSVIIYTYELVELMSVVAVAFCIVYATMEKSHVVVDLVINHIPQKIRSVLGIISSFIGLATWIIIAIANIGFTKQQWILGEITDILEIPITPFRCIWIFALIIIILLIVLQLIESLRKVVKK